ncbi:MAG: hypothetical protein IOC39_24205 [Burkholderia sp.]|jgi:hypothetical protein|uniref:hypothetical protein n=1 Tax=Burkholderia sp. TaxID=36773 RepID=UPI00258E0C69|nr:hypothetical protein [Burkholderia sp.]MCA3780134.1 hypothetical protein [Burkholderia sp.]MCA3796254.1 hypothetical protein [Burkholderia sp.]MCA3802911.1 hypothetical protein [Burkholderia sp.]MCA3810862.1 hypothetical protein [Burkholderia sp.]MCA3818924.1 hypothetical protein [Burkholderia sp.]
MTAGIHNSADIIAVVGATSMGKGLYIKPELRRTPKSRGIVVWSPLEETDDYATVIGGRVYRSIAEMVDAIKRGEKRLVFVPEEGDKRIKEQFDRFCRLVWHLDGWVVVIEELSGVTMPSWAPPAWKKLTTAGRHRGLKIYGTTQRPALVDKSFFGNCTEIRCYRVGYEEDARTMKGVMFVDHREFLKLPQFHFIHHHKATGTNTSGVVHPPKK